jgi:general secretion pathway protein I
MTSRARRVGAARGFTLIEIMVALAIMGGLLVTLLYTVHYHLGIAGRHEARTVATMLGREKLSEMREAPRPTMGTFGAPHEDYTFATAVAPSAYAGVSVLTVTVLRGDEKVVVRELVPGGG